MLSRTGLNVPEFRGTRSEFDPFRWLDGASGSLRCAILPCLAAMHAHEVIKRQSTLHCKCDSLMFRPACLLCSTQCVCAEGLSRKRALWP